MSSYNAKLAEMSNELSMLIDYFQNFTCFLRRPINISVTLVSESYA